VAGVTTAAVRIVQLSPEALTALAAGDVERASTLSGLALTPWQVSDREIATWRRRAAQVVDTPADLDWVTSGLQTTPSVRTPSSSAQSKTNTARSTPIWQAARPTPSAAYIVSTMSATRDRSSSS
jgi:hypothetical protein